MESSEALRTHGTLEEAVESLFGDRNPGGKCLKTCPRVGKLRCHFTDVLVFELLYCFLGFQMPVLGERISTNLWRRKKMTTRTTTTMMGESGSSNKRTVPERSR